MPTKSISSRHAPIPETPSPTSLPPSPATYCPTWTPRRTHNPSTRRVSSAVSRCLSSRTSGSRLVSSIRSDPRPISSRYFLLASMYTRSSAFLIIDICTLASFVQSLTIVQPFVASVHAQRTPPISRTSSESTVNVSPTYGAEISCQITPLGSCGLRFL